eukprot:symbB.v1.2.041477.t1/scaffold8256.1/size7074/2
MLSKAMRSGFYSCCKVVDLKRDFAFADNEFDMSLCLGTLTYMEPADLTLAELCRVTKPGGYVCFSMRTDLCEKWESAQQSFVDKNIWTHMGTSEGFDYLPANPEYGNTILVKVYIYKAQMRSQLKKLTDEVTSKIAVNLHIFKPTLHSRDSPVCHFFFTPGLMLPWRVWVSDRRRARMHPAGSQEMGCAVSPAIWML